MAGKGDKPEEPRPPFWEVPGPWPFPSSAEIEQRFEELVRARWGGREGSAPADVFIYGEEIWVEVDLPGVPEEAVRVVLERGMLLVEASRPAPASGEQAQPARIERPRGPIRRRVPLPAPLAAARIEFRLESGVLRVRLRPEEER